MWIVALGQGVELKITVEPKRDRSDDEPDTQTFEGAFERDD